jgi:branched-chain amino acid transport system substrate-binding protein
VNGNHVSRRTHRTLVLGLAVALTAGLLAGCSRPVDPIRVGAVYPLSGEQGPGGLEEFHGVQLAADLVDADGGVLGRPVELVPIDAAGSDAAAAAIQDLHAQGIGLVTGSYGSTISSPAADAADKLGMLFWETGAVGEMLGSGAGRTVFRVAPSGVVLGAAAIDFIADQLAPALHRDPAALRFAVANVDDLYGAAVATGATEEIRRLGLPLAGQVPYALRDFDPAAVVHRLAALRPDVVFVSAYLDDGVAVRREMVRQHLKLVANIGSSSSYCMQAFGDRLGADAVGVFASDKPDAESLDPTGLSTQARALLQRANAGYRQRYGTDMSAAALAGFAAGWALFHVVLPNASDVSPDGVASAALHADLPAGSLPNGSGLRFGPAGSPTAGSNVLAASVIWEWTSLDWRAVVWPPRFATEPLRLIPIAA